MGNSMQSTFTLLIHRNYFFIIHSGYGHPSKYSGNVTILEAVAEGIIANPKYQ